MLLEFTLMPLPFPPILRTLAITWPQTVFGPEMRCLVAAQVDGIVRLDYLPSMMVLPSQTFL